MSIRHGSKKLLTTRIHEIDWEDAKRDERRFLRPVDAESLSLWGNRFFESKLSKMLNGE